MAKNAIKHVIMQQKIEGAIDDLMVRTDTDSLVVNQETGKTLTTELAEIVALIAGKATPEDIDARIDALIGAAPTALDTLKEIADALDNDPDFAATMTTQLAGKVDKVAGKGLSTEDFTAELKAKLEGITGYVHPASHSATMITQDAAHRFVTDAEKIGWNAKGRILSGTTTPADMTEADLVLQIID